MFHRAAISERELADLTEILGDDLSIVMPVFWCIELHTSKTCLKIVPEEMPTPDYCHPTGTVDRPMILKEARSSLEEIRQTFFDHLGSVKRINIISTLVSFSEVTLYPEMGIGDVKIPVGEGYRFLYHNPTDLELVQNQLPKNSALIALDIGIEFVTERYPNLIAYTSGFTIQASFSGFPDTEWIAADAWARRPVSNRSTT